MHALAAIIASAIILIVIVAFGWRRRFAVAGFMFLFFLFTLHTMLPIGRPVTYVLRWVLFTLCIMGWTLVSFSQRNYPVHRSIPMFALLFIASAWLSAFFGVHLFDAVFRPFTFLLLFFLAYIILPADTLDNRLLDLYKSVFVFDLIIVFCSAVGLFSPDFYLDGRFEGIVYRATGLSAYAYTLLILALVAYSRASRFSLFSVVTALVSLVVLVLTKSRAGYLAALAGVLTFFFLANKKVFAVLVITACLVPALLLPFQPEWGNVSSSLLRGRSLQEILGGRGRDAQEALEIFLKHPFFGIGMGSVAEPTPSWMGRGSEELTLIHTRRLGGNTGYLLILYETGVFGFTFYLLWLSLSFFSGWGNYTGYFKPHSAALAPVWAGFLGLLVAYGLHGLFEGYPAGVGSTVSIRIWALAGLFAFYGQSGFLNSQKSIV